MTKVFRFLASTLGMKSLGPETVLNLAELEKTISSLDGKRRLRSGMKNILHSGFRASAM